MIDQFTIFTRGGVILWQRQINPVTGEPVNSLIRDVLMEEKGSEDGYAHQNYQVSWTFDNSLELVFVAVYLNLGNVLLYIEPLLEDLKKSFASIFADAVKSGIINRHEYEKFNPIYDKIVDRHENSVQNTRRVKSFHETKKGKDTLQLDHRTGKQREQALKEADRKRKEKEKAQRKARSKGESEEDAEDEDDGEADASEEEPAPSQPESTTSTSPTSTTASTTASATASATVSDTESSPSSPRGNKNEPSFNKDKLAELLKRKKAGGASAGAKKKETPPVTVEEVPKKPKKVMAERNLRAKDLMKELDRSGTSSDTAAADAARVAQTRAIYGDAPTDSTYADDEGSDSEDDTDTTTSSTPSKPTSGFLSRIFQPISGMVGNRILTRDDLDTTLTTFKESLMAKNVAADIAEKLCESISKSLEGQKQQTFTTIHQTVKKAIDDSLTRILTPSRPIDVIQGVISARERGHPYVIVFCGVNGVGKSTSLAKVAAYFLSNNFSVGIGGCDTFRSGAIEQLRTHAQCLKVPLYEKGYDRDAASVAADAISQAKRDKLDVILIDTTGRMQDNTPLMRALSKLINTNKPDLVLFVGEALVGNDAVDQIQKFNRCLQDLSEEKTPRLIDGIILTKFDTIDDKVGAAISMTYTTGKPIVFVGTGQTYRDLKKMNVRMLIRSLLK